MRLSPARLVAMAKGQLFAVIMLVLGPILVLAGPVLFVASVWGEESRYEHAAVDPTAVVEAKGGKEVNLLLEGLSNVTDECQVTGPNGEDVQINYRSTLFGSPESRTIRGTNYIAYAYINTTDAGPYTFTCTGLSYTPMVETRKLPSQRLIPSVLMGGVVSIIGIVMVIAGIRGVTKRPQPRR